MCVSTMIGGQEHGAQHRDDDAPVSGEGEAPSICAAFRISLSMPRSAARNIAITKPDVCQMPAIATQ